MPEAITNATPTGGPSEPGPTPNLAEGVAGARELPLFAARALELGLLSAEDLDAAQTAVAEAEAGDGEHVSLAAYCLANALLTGDEYERLADPDWSPAAETVSLDGQEAGPVRVGVEVGDDGPASSIGKITSVLGRARARLGSGGPIGGDEAGGDSPSAPTLPVMDLAVGGHDGDGRGEVNGRSEVDGGGDGSATDHGGGSSLPVPPIASTSILDEPPYAPRDAGTAKHDDHTLTHGPTAPRDASKRADSSSPSSPSSLSSPSSPSAPSAGSGRHAATGRGRSSRRRRPSRLPGSRGSGTREPDLDSSRDTTASIVDARDKYRVLGEIARGGMGRVLEAHDPVIRRDIAIKTLLTRGSESESQANARVLRFLEEVQVAGQLEHPNIVPVHDVGLDADGRLFFTMKRVRGESLAHILKQLRRGRPYRGLTRNQLLGIFVKVCDAVGFAHSRGVIHRDIKPENIMVGEYGEVLVMDWGLAKIIGASEAKRDGLVLSDRSEHGLVRTLDGQIVGTPAYMPPEQANGDVDRLDERTDIYSLGAVLYELLTFRPPYVGDTPFRVLMQVVKGAPDAPRKRSPDQDIPPELDAIVMRAMAPQKQHRYPTVAKLQADVVAHLEGRRPEFVTPSRAWQVRRWFARVRGMLIGAAVTLAIAAVAAVLSMPAIEAQQRDAEANASAREREAMRDLAARRVEQLAVQHATRVRRWKDAGERVANLEAMLATGATQTQPGAQRLQVSGDLIEARAALARARDSAIASAQAVRGAAETITVWTQSVTSAVADAQTTIGRAYAELAREATRLGDHEAAQRWAMRAQEYGRGIDGNELPSRVPDVPRGALTILAPRADVPIAVYRFVPGTRFGADARMVPVPLARADAVLHGRSADTARALAPMAGRPLEAFIDPLAAIDDNARVAETLAVDERGSTPLTLRDLPVGVYAVRPLGAWSSASAWLPWQAATVRADAEAILRLVCYDEPRDVARMPPGVAARPISMGAAFPAVWMGVDEVRVRDYAAYLRWLLERAEQDADIETVRTRLPRVVDARVWEVRDGELVVPDFDAVGDQPVRGVSVADALAYASWLQRGMPGWMVRLPTVTEWRAVAKPHASYLFPCGPRFDRAFLAPALDCSPFGVRALMGGVREWCVEMGDVWIAGGCSDERIVGAFEAARLEASDTRTTRWDTGFRLVFERTD